MGVPISSHLTHMVMHLILIGNTNELMGRICVAILMMDQLIVQENAVNIKKFNYKYIKRGKNV